MQTTASKQQEQFTRSQWYNNALSKSTTLIHITGRDSDKTPKFPTETFEAIIDQVYSLNEKDSDVDKLLGVFSLVSKSWLPRSRYHLFQRLTIRRGMQTVAKPFLDLLDSPLCSFKPYVQILELDDRWYRDPIWLKEALPRLSVLLPAVRELWINNGVFHTSLNAAKVLSDFGNLQLLVLDGCYFDSPAKLFETLSMCRSLKRIGFTNLRMTDPAIAVINSPPPSSLTFIQMYDAVSTNDVMEWLFSGGQVPAIETLNLSAIWEDESAAFGHGLRRLGACLKNLEVQFMFDRSIQNDFLRDVDVGYNTNLNSICYRFCPASVGPLLAQVTSSEVRDVVVDVGSAAGRLNEVDWDAVARILDQPNFSKLEKLIIPAGCLPRAVERVRQWVTERLLPGRARDKLVVCEQWFGNHP